MDDPQKMDHTPKHRSAQFLFWEILERIDLMINIVRHHTNGIHLAMKSDLPPKVRLHDLAEIDRSERGDSISWRLGVDEAQADAIEPHVGKGWVAVDQTVVFLNIIRIHPMRDSKSEA